MKISMLCCLLFIFLLIGCATESEKKQNEAEKLYTQAEYYVKKKRFLLAQEKLNEIKTQYPYSLYATKSELKLADILFYQENYVESAAAYSSFRDLHPKYEQLSYVIWRIAESYYNQMPSTHDRDLSAAKESIKFFEELIETYPQSEYVPMAKERIFHVKDMILKQELYIADFYFKTGVFDSAKFRYEDIEKKYSHNRELMNQVKMRIVEASFGLKDYKGCYDLSERFISEVDNEDTVSNLKNLQEKCKKRF